MPVSDRHVQLMQLLRQHQRPVSAQSLAKALGVSLRSIYRDVEALRAQGANLQGEAGVGYTLEPGLLLPALLLNEAELAALVQALSAAPKGPGREGLLRKLRAALPADVARGLTAPAPEAPPKAKARIAPRPAAAATAPVAKVEEAPWAKAPSLKAPAAKKAGAKAKAAPKAAPEAKAPAAPPAPKAKAASAAKAKASALPWPELAASALPKPMAEALKGGKKLHAVHGEARRARSERVLWPLAAVDGPDGPQLVAWCEAKQAVQAFRLATLHELAVLPAKVGGDRQALLKAWAAQEA